MRFLLLRVALGLLLSGIAVTCGSPQETETDDIPTNPATPEPITTTDPNSEVKTSGIPTTTAKSTTDSASRSAEYANEITQLIEIVEKIRGLQFLEKPKILLLEQEAFHRRLGKIAEEEYSDLEAIDALYQLLGLLEDGDSLESIYADMFARSVSAYYDSDTREVVVPIDETELDLQERSSLIHELVHALTDQHFGFGNTYEKLEEEFKYDQAFALQALVEGDAVETELVYFITELTPEEQDEIFKFEEPPEEVTQTLPAFLESSFVFPYAQGRLFVKELLDDKMLKYQDEEFEIKEEFYKRVNDAYHNPPISTEQIFEPNKYPTEIPLEVEHALPNIPGYELDHVSSWGALWFSLMFDQALDPGDTIVKNDERPVTGFEPQPTAKEWEPAVEGWGGDVYSYWFNGDDAAFALTFRGDESTDASELFEAMRKYISAAMNVGDPVASDEGTTWRGEDFAWLAVSGDMLRFVAASDPEVGSHLVSYYK